MLKVLIFSLVTSCAAYTTRRYDYDYGNYQPVAPLLDNTFAFRNGNRRQPVQVYEYPKRYDGAVKLSDSLLNHGSVFNSEDNNRRVDMQYNRHAYQDGNGEDTWNRAVSEPTQVYNTFETNLDGKNQNHKIDTNDRRKDGQQKRVITQTNETNKLNEAQVNGNITQLSTQSDDVNRTRDINEIQITTNNYQRKRNQSSTKDNANITTSSNISANNNTATHSYITRDDAMLAIINRTGSVNLSPVRFNSNSINKTSKQNTDKNDHRTKTYNTNNNTIKDNNRFNTTVNIINSNRNDYNSTKYESKTTQDNEVTIRTHEGRTDKDEDRWIWSNSDDKIVETTTLFDLGDRAAFSGNGCPDGKVKIGNTCVTPD